MADVSPAASVASHINSNRADARGDKVGLAAFSFRRYVSARSVTDWGTIIREKAR
jgi:hypothetical protein